MERFNSKELCYFVKSYKFENVRMKKILLALLSVALFYSCDDGDIIVTSFDFGDQSLQLCGDPGDYVFFKINNDAQESISLYF